MLSAGYTHSYRSDVLLGGSSTTGQDDTAFMRLDWLISAWNFHAGGTYSYVRFDSTDELGLETSGALHLGGAEAGVSLTLLRGLTADLTYRFDLLDSASASAEVNITEYNRHMASLGITITWPPPPQGEAEPLIAGFDI
jgi:hypothetical protein